MLINAIQRYSMLFNVVRCQFNRTLRLINGVSHVWTPAANATPRCRCVVVSLPMHRWIAANQCLINANRGNSLQIAANRNLRLGTAADASLYRC